MAREPLLRRLTAASLALVLVVIVASAAIRLSGRDLGELLGAVRGTHRVSASLATLTIAALAWLAWRAGRRLPAAAILVATLFLSVLGAATGVSPPPLAQAGNLLGGLVLAALLARLLAAGTAISPAWPFPALLLLALQASLGAWISIFAEAPWSWALLAHVALGLALAAAAARLALQRSSFALLALAFAVPASGAAAALFGTPLAASLAHSTSVALLVAAAACLTHIKGVRAPS